MDNKTRVEMRLFHAVWVQDTPAYCYGLPGNRLHISTAKVVCMTSLQEQVARLVLEFKHHFVPFFFRRKRIVDQQN